MQYPKKEIESGVEVLCLAFNVVQVLPDKTRLKPASLYSFIIAIITDHLSKGN